MKDVSDVYNMATHICQIVDLNISSSLITVKAICITYRMV